ncbi:coiled-coil domain-containing protein 170 [Leptosomus discolor]
MPVGGVGYTALTAPVALDWALRSFAATSLDRDGALAGASCPVQISLPVTHEDGLEMCHQEAFTTSCTDGRYVYPQMLPEMEAPSTAAPPAFPNQRTPLRPPRQEPRGPSAPAPASPPERRRAQAAPPAPRCQGDGGTTAAAMSGGRAGSGGPCAVPAAPRLAGGGGSAAAEVPRRWALGSGPPLRGRRCWFLRAGGCGLPWQRVPGEERGGRRPGRGGGGRAGGPGGLPSAGPGRAAARRPRAAVRAAEAGVLGSLAGTGQSGAESHDHVPLDIPVTREQMNRYRAAAETAQSELAALSVKYDCAQSELLELRSRMVSKEASFQKLKAEAESYKENNARQMSRLLSLQTRIQEMEEEACVLATSKNQAELTAQVAFKENWELKEELHEEKAKLNKRLNEYEESMTQASKISRKYEELLTQLSGFLDTDIREKEKPQEYLMSKVSEICKENLILKDQVAALQEAINVHEMESKASRETIMRLVSEVTKEQKKAAGYHQDREKLSKDLDRAIIGRQSLEMEIRNLQDKLTANQKALDASRRELHNLKKFSSELDGSLKSSREEARTAQSSLVAFQEQIATLLSSGSATVKPSEKTILERIQEINCKEESKEIIVSQLETQIAKLTEAVGNQTRLYQEALERSRKAEKCSETFQDQLKQLEEELLAADLLQDGLKLEKQKLKSQKAKLESKELHMNLLRQKITQLEEEKQVRTALAVERDEANLAVRKLHKMIERLQKQLDLAKETNTDLKAKLSETNELKIKTLEQNRMIEELNKSQGKLERMKEKAEKQLTSVKSELLLKDRKATEDKEKNKNMLEAVTSEMKVLKTTLAELAKRERQLADFREVVSQMLGLNIASLALPDYEIITRLKGLIHSHQHHCFPCVCLKDVAKAPEEHRSIQLLN